MTSFADFFRRATGDLDPFPFQTVFATGHEVPALVKVPTGLGKTAMVILGWLWRRQYAAGASSASVPRRLVYCLPMRVLVEQTRDNAVEWLSNLGLADAVRVHVVMGGEEAGDADLWPEQDAVIIGTQDMLLSRALNRGYAMTRSRWPMSFALLNNDALWIMDEVQLMGSALATTAQLEAFRREMGTCGPTRSVWMSATLDRRWLRTVDLDPGSLGPTHELSDADLGILEVANRYRAEKRVGRAQATTAQPTALSEEVLAAHVPGTRTLVVVNTVDRARQLFRETRRRLTSRPGAPEVVLVHSRYRPPDRARHIEQVLAEPPAAGLLILATQVVEAGLDVSAKTLFTEVAPWASLVQRLGRCNRRGEFGRDDPGQVRWMDLDVSEGNDKVAERAAAPYLPEELRASRARLVELEGGSASPESLDRLGVEMPYRHTHVIRRKDVIELFDTTPDLAGSDLDIDRYVRDVEHTDVRVFWRDLASRPPAPGEPPPSRIELCAVPVDAMRSFVKRLSDMKAYRRNFLERRWDAVSERLVTPGQVYLLDSSVGGYDPEIGWTGKAGPHHVTVNPPQPDPTRDDGNEADELSLAGSWQTVAEHTDSVCLELDRLLDELWPPFSRCLQIAARWHDWGKAHPIFQQALPVGRPDAGRAWAKAPREGWQRYERRQFRHELASSLALLTLEPEALGLDGGAGASSRSSDDTALEARELRDLAAYIVAAHHGKVRLSIRSLPTEKRPPGGRRFARGIWDGDRLPAVDLGGGFRTAPDVTLSLEPMELGLCQDVPFAGQPSWAERMLRLRDRLGPFRLACLEALLRAADMRASAVRPEP